MTYTVVARPAENGWWALSCPEIRGAHSQVRELGGAADAARDANAGVLGISADDVDVALDVDLPR